MKDYTDLSEYTVDDMKVFRTNLYTYMAAPTLLHALIGYYELEWELEIFIEEIEEVNLEEGMWDSDSVTDEDREYAKNIEVMNLCEINEEPEPKIGTLANSRGNLTRFTSFADVIKREGVGIYIIY